MEKLYNSGCTNLFMALRIFAPPCVYGTSYRYEYEVSHTSMDMHNGAIHVWTFHMRIGYPVQVLIVGGGGRGGSYC